jgi:hypothetical protein
VTSHGSPLFWRLYRGLSPEIRAAAREAYGKFLQNPAHPGLRLERLRTDPRAWSVRVTSDYRAVARRHEGDVWVWIWIGSHKEFDRQFPR